MPVLIPACTNCMPGGMMSLAIPEFDRFDCLQHYGASVKFIAFTYPAIQILHTETVRIQDDKGQSSGRGTIMAHDKSSPAKTFEKNVQKMNPSIRAHSLYTKFLDNICSDSQSMDGVKQIYKIIDDVVFGSPESQFIISLNAGETYYRARIISPSDYAAKDKGIGIKPDGTLQGYNEDNSREPPLGKSDAGRNNISGISYLYLASNPETACTEVKPQLGSLISLATFKITEPMKIVDFSADKKLPIYHTEKGDINLNILFSKLMFQFSEPILISEGKAMQYLPTQLIADYARKKGFDGIKYQSALVPGGYNYTIFKSHPSNIQFLGSKILLYRQANYAYWDFNENCALFSNPADDLFAYDKDVAEKMKKDMRSVLSSFGFEE